MPPKILGFCFDLVISCFSSLFLLFLVYFIVLIFSYFSSVAARLRLAFGFLLLGYASLGGTECRWRFSCVLLVVTCLFPSLSPAPHAVALWTLKDSKTPPITCSPWVVGTFDVDWTGSFTRNNSLWEAGKTVQLLRERIIGSATCIHQMNMSYLGETVTLDLVVLSLPRPQSFS